MIHSHKSTARLCPGGAPGRRCPLATPCVGPCSLDKRKLSVTMEDDIQEPFYDWPRDRQDDKSWTLFGDWVNLVQRWGWRILAGIVAWCLMAGVAVWVIFN